MVNLDGAKLSPNDSLYLESILAEQKTLWDGIQKKNSRKNTKRNSNSKGSLNIKHHGKIDSLYPLKSNLQPFENSTFALSLGSLSKDSDHFEASLKTIQPYGQMYKVSIKKGSTLASTKDDRRIKHEKKIMKNSETRKLESRYFETKGIYFKDLEKNQKEEPKTTSPELSSTRMRSVQCILCYSRQYVSLSSDNLLCNNCNCLIHL